MPIGLAHNVTLKHALSAGASVRWSDVDFDAADETLKVRREMERMALPNAAASAAE